MVYFNCITRGAFGPILQSAERGRRLSVVLLHVVGVLPVPLCGDVPAVGRAARSVPQHGEDERVQLVDNSIEKLKSQLIF